jgi:DUF1009 family protein
LVEIALQGSRTVDVAAGEVVDRGLVGEIALQGSRTADVAAGEVVVQEKGTADVAAGEVVVQEKVTDVAEIEGTQELKIGAEGRTGST